MKKFKILPVACAALAAVSAVHAQTTEPAKELGTVNVIGSVDDLQSLDFYAPNSSAVIKPDTMQALGARKLDQALQYQAGIVSEPFGADNKVEWFKIRGFEASTALDGTPTTPNGYFVWKPELFGVEAAEVVKGANSLVFGAANTGGVVNLVTKRPHKEQALTVNAETGNRGKLGVGVDYNGLANADGSVYWRVVAQARKEDGAAPRWTACTWPPAPPSNSAGAPRSRCWPASSARTARPPTASCPPGARSSTRPTAAWTAAPTWASRTSTT